MLPASKAIPKELLPGRRYARPSSSWSRKSSPRESTEIVDGDQPGQGRWCSTISRRLLNWKVSLSGAASATCSKSCAGSPRLARITTRGAARTAGLGHAVLQARSAVGDEPFAVILPDDIFDCERPCLRPVDRRGRGARRAGGGAVAVAARGDVSKYGIVEAQPLGAAAASPDRDGREAAVEKLRATWRSWGATYSAGDFRMLAEGKPGQGGEIQLTDALLELGRRRPLYGYEFEGTRYDLGDRLGSVTAQIAYGFETRELADKLRAYLATIISPQNPGRGSSSAGRALRSQRRGRGFKSLLLHHPVPQFSDISENRSKSTRVRGFVLPGGPRKSSKTALRRIIGQKLSSSHFGRSILTNWRIATKPRIRSIRSIAE